MGSDAEPQVVPTREASGDREMIDKLLPEIYGELRRIAADHLRRERRNHTLHTTALVHEAYLRLVDQRRIDWANRPQVLALAARTVWRVLVDYARRRNARICDGPRTRVAIDESLAWSTESELDLAALDDALRKLSSLHARQASIVELRFFGGLSVDETALALGISPRTVDGDWSVARAWLAREMPQVDRT